MEWGGVEAWGIERGAVHSYGVFPYCTAKVRAHSTTSLKPTKPGLEAMADHLRLQSQYLLCDKNI